MGALCSERPPAWRGERKFGGRIGGDTQGIGKDIQSEATGGTLGNRNSVRSKRNVFRTGSDRRAHLKAAARRIFAERNAHVSRSVHLKQPAARIGEHDARQVVIVDIETVSRAAGNFPSRQLVRRGGTGQCKDNLLVNGVAVILVGSDGEGRLGGVLGNRQNAVGIAGARYADIVIVFNGYCDGNGIVLRQGVA